MEMVTEVIGADVQMEGDPDKERPICMEDVSTLAVKNFELSSKSETQSNERDSDDEPPDRSCEFIGNALEKLWASLGDFFSERSAVARSIIYIIFAILYNVYFVASVHYSIRNGIPMDWCDGVGFLIVLTGIIYLGLFYFQIVKKFWGKSINRAVMKPAGKAFDRAWKYSWVRYGFYLVLSAGLLTFLIIDTADERVRLQSFGGLLIFLLLGWIFSKYPSRVIWRHVAWGITLQLIFGLIVLRWDFGRRTFECLGSKFSLLLDYSVDGSEFVYGYLASDQNASGIALGTIFAFRILSVIYFFSFLINLLYYYGAMQWTVEKLGWLLQISVGTTAAESMNAAANIFLGQTEAPLLIKPFLSKMTKSEIHAVFTAGFATIAGSDLAAYTAFGISASQLLSASVMAAPVALAVSKLLYPETEKSQTKARDIKVPKGSEVNALDAAAQGAAMAVLMVAHVIANLIAFLAFIAFLNGVISWFGNLLGVPYITFEWILSKLFIPIAWLMGVPSSECYLVANLVAIKTVVNEFAAYGKLSEYIAQGAISKRAETIATFALCGYANPGSIGAQIGTLSAMAPGRQSDFAKVAFRAFVAGSMANFMNACVAGALISTVSDGASI
ncbi:Solute carrier family 28 member 3 [Daphnia magna]|uniref:Sodium/nucleoside cotransporter n=1 Tax=Daphnia magna TaxID=35525 RepID=A0A0N8D7F0_9CRUS|nr:Solute carrier family 28 member 3 [Daphnia magna]